MNERILNWEGCFNVRDLGGLPTLAGGHIRSRAVVRADSPHRLTAVGRAALTAYGIRTIVDLRTPKETRETPNPFAAAASPRVCFASVIDPDDAPGRQMYDAASHIFDAYLLNVERHAHCMAEAVRAVARAEVGPVLVHCHAGKDRTGLVVALALAVAGVGPQIIADDYALSHQFAGPLYEEDRAHIAAHHPEKLELVLRNFHVCAPEVMRAVLGHIDRVHGGAEAYLRTAGLSAEDIEHLQQRLRE